MSNARVDEFGQLAGADLVLDRIYRGGALLGTRDDPQYQDACGSPPMV